ncbi:MAG: ZIP family metal transporter [Bradymonadaceae bacterium]
METSLLLLAFVTGLISAIATGLGAPLVSVLPLESDTVRACTSAVAAGMMLSASVFSLTQEGIEMGETVRYATPKVIVGLLLGTFILWILSEAFEGEDEHEHPFAQLDLSSESLLMFVALLVHSSPEGIAIGVGFATGDMDFGILMATAISIHNVPEGIAMSLPMRAEGESILKCSLISILTSIPQPLFAVPAALGFHYVQPWLPLGLGFAGGAMIYVVVIELIPDAYAHGSQALTAWGVMIGLTLMLTLSVVLPGG